MNPAHDRGRVRFDAALLHHLSQVAIADPVLAVPANAKQNDLHRKPTALEHKPIVARPPATIRVNATEPIAVLDADGGRLVLLDPATGSIMPVARNLPVGHLTQPYYRSGGVAVGTDGTIYIAADSENALYCISQIH